MDSIKINACSLPETIPFCFNVLISIYEKLLVFLLSIAQNSNILLLCLMIVWVRNLDRAQQG